MNELHVIDVNVSFDTGICKAEDHGVRLKTGDYNSTKFVFNFDHFADGRKVLEMRNPSGKTVMMAEITDNEVLIGGKDENDEPCSILNEQGYYILEISLYGENSKLTSAFGEVYVEAQQVECEDIELPTPSIIDQINTDLAKLGNIINSMVFAQFDVDMTTGEVYAIVPDGFDDLDFSINVNGEMEMIIDE